MKVIKIRKTTRIRMAVLLLGVLQSTCFQLVNAQSFQNYDFEVISDENAHPIEWYVVEEEGCSFELDSMVSFTGKFSFAIHPITELKPCSATLLNDIEKTSFKGKDRIRVVMHAKLKDTNAEVSPFIRQLSKDGVEVQRARGVPSRMAKISSNWEVIELEEKIELSTEHMAFGVTTSSFNSIWIDRFEIYIDDEKLVDSNTPLMSPPSLKQLNWLNKSIVPIGNPGAFMPAFLKNDVKNATFVALGEVTHGSSEIYQLKDQMVRFLITNMNFRVLALEMDITDAEPLNDYITNGKGDSRAILSQIGYWSFQTEEFLSLLEWLRNFNRNKEEKVKIVGFDIPLSDKAVNPILEFSIRTDTTLYKKALALKEAFFQCHHGSLEEIVAFENQIDSLYATLEKKQALLSTTIARNTYEKVVQKLLSLKQTAAYYKAELNGEILHRDKYMAQNISEFAERNKHLKIIIWAHNAHISRSEDYGAGMGRYLSSEYPIYTIGFSLGQGSFTGTDLANLGKLSTYQLKSPISDSYESFFIQCKYPNFFLKLKGVKRASGNEWLNEVHKLRYIGAGIYGRYQFVKTTLTKNFDAIIFINDSTPSHLLVK